MVLLRAPPKPKKTIGAFLLFFLLFLANDIFCFVLFRSVLLPVCMLNVCVHIFLSHKKNNTMFSIQWGSALPAPIPWKRTKRRQMEEGENQRQSASPYSRLLMYVQTSGILRQCHAWLDWRSFFFLARLWTNVRQLKKWSTMSRLFLGSSSARPWRPSNAIWRYQVLAMESKMDLEISRGWILKFPHSWSRSVDCCSLLAFYWLTDHHPFHSTP